jgi:hypothetical protein
VAGLEKQQLVIEITKCLFWFNLQQQRWTPALYPWSADSMHWQEVIAANQKFHRFVQNVQFFAQSVFQRPGEGNDALLK